MDLKQYTQDAIRTESQIDEVLINPKLLINVLAMYISAGQMLDQIKKNVFYSVEINPDVFNASYLTVRDALEDIAGTPINEPVGEDHKCPINPRVFHAIIGIATESTELCEALYTTLLGKDLDVVNLLEENGDIHWYQAIMMDELDGDWEKTFATNIEKLRARFPEKFTNDKAVNRDLDTERDILEK